MGYLLVVISFVGNSLAGDLGMHVEKINQYPSKGICETVKKNLQEVIDENTFGKKKPKAICVPEH